MRKLRKHMQPVSPPSHEEESNSHQPSELQSDSSLSVTIAQKGNLIGKSKYNLRQQMVERYEKRGEAEETKQSQQEVTAGEAEQKQHHFDEYLNKLSDDDGADLEYKSKKTKKKEIKPKNKFFSGLELENQEIEEKVEEVDEIRVERRESRGADHLMEKVQKRATFFKNRLEFKELENDHKFKQDMKQKLKSLDDFEEIKIVVDVPKVLGGRKSHVQAALFLKNNQSQDSELTQTAQEEESSLPKDRKTYYEELNKKLKMKKAQSFTESAMKNCFKKSYLDETDFIADLEENKHRDEKSNTNSKEYGSLAVSRKSQPKSVQVIELSDDDISSVAVEITKNQTKNVKVAPLEASNNSQQNKENIAIYERIEEKTDNNGSEFDKKSKQTVVIQAKKEKLVPKPQKKSKPRKKKSDFNIKDLLQIEAESSQDENGPKRDKQNQEQESEDDDHDISSLIDDDVTVDQSQQHRVHQKFVNDMIEKEEKQYKMLLEKAQKQRFIEEERLKERMREAAKKNIEKEKKADTSYVQPAENAKKQEIIETDSETCKNKNIQKFKELEAELGLTKDKPEESQQKKHASLERVKQIEGCMFGLKTIYERKPQRQGLKGISLKKTNPPKTAKTKK